MSRESSGFRAGLHDGRRFIARGGKLCAEENLASARKLARPGDRNEAAYLRGIEAAIKEYGDGS